MKQVNPSRTGNWKQPQGELPRGSGKMQQPMTPKGKFAKANFGDTVVEQMTPDLDVPGRGFRCSRREFATFWKRGRIRRECISSICQCWIVRHNGDLAAYVTLLADKLEVENTLLEEENIRYHTFPAVKIGLLAADERANGAGTRLMEWSLWYIATQLCPRIGVRFVTVDALFDPDTGYDTSGYYRRFGFRLLAPDAQLPPTVPYRTMFADILPVVSEIETVV